MQNDDLQDLIEICSDKIGLPGVFIEKDFYLTQALHMISDINNPYFSLVFHGGTALAKAHKIVERMSEDCDFRIHASPDFLALNKSQRRNMLHSYRHEMLAYFKKNGFNILEEGRNTRDQGNYFTFNLQYYFLYPANKILRPHIQLEFMVVDSRLPTLECPVTTLIRQTLGESIDHKIKTLTCVSVNETAAEKWVALTRRVANAMRCPDKFPDPTLVRHIYDLYCIQQKQGINQTSYSLIDELVKEDAIRYKNQNINYVQDPVSEIKWSLSLLTENKEWAKNWDNFMQSMVYSETKPDYKTALGHLAKISQPILDQLSTVKKSDPR